MGATALACNCWRWVEFSGRVGRGSLCSTVVGEEVVRLERSGHNRTGVRSWSAPLLMTICSDGVESSWDTL